MGISWKNYEVKLLHNIQKNILQKLCIKSSMEWKYSCYELCYRVWE